MKVIRSRSQHHNLKILLRMMQLYQDKLLKAQKSHIIQRFSQHGMSQAKSLMQYYIHLNSQNIFFHDNK